MTEDALMDFKTERDIQALSNFLAEFSLSADPFETGLGYWACPARQQLLEKLIHQSLFGSGLLVVSAETGAGKSRMAEQLFDEFSQDGLAVLLSGRGGLDAILAQLLQQLLASQFISQAQALSELRSFYPSDDEAILLILDDAEHLSESELASLISILPINTNAAISLVLFAEPQLIGRLALVELGDLPVHDFHLEHLSEEQAHSYITHQISQGDDGISIPFEQEEISQWWRASSGNIAELNRLASARLLALSKNRTDEESEQTLETRTTSFVEALQRSSSAAEAAPLDTSLPFAESEEFFVDEDLEVDRPAKSGLPVVHLVLLSGLLAVLLMAYFYLGEEDAQPDRKVVSVNVSNKKPLDDLLADIQKPVGQKTAAAERTRESLVGGTQNAGQAEQSAAGADALSDSAVSLNDAVDQGSKDSALAGLEISNSLAQVVAAAEPVVKSVVRPVAEPAVEPVAQMQTLQPSEKPVLPVVALSGVSKNSESAPSSSGKVKLSADEKYLLKLERNRFALQILGARTRPSIDQFLVRQSNRADLRVYVTRRQGRVWYVVLAGNYPDSDSARQAIATLPAEQKKSGPWPKQFGDVQAEIKAFRGI